MNQSVVNKRFIQNEAPFSSRGISLDLSEAQYELIRQKLVSLCGIELGHNKQVLTKSRLYKRMTELSLIEFSQYLNFLKENPAEVIHFINSMTTNKTDWFREPRHFSYLIDTVLPDFYKKSQSTWMQNNSRDFYIWSAASSTGEEAYSLAMAMNENLKPGYNYRILGTDIDTQVLQRAADAVYRLDHIQEQVPLNFQQNYFLKTGQNQNQLKVCPELTKNVKIRKFNLIEGDLPVDIQFDVIFLRNVLIYFSRATIEHVIRRILRYLRPGGHLFIGLSESLNGFSLPLVNVSESVYKLEK